jgi:hypothetical protein
MALQRTQDELRPVVLPPDEQPHANAAATAEGSAERARRGRPFAKGNAASRGRKPSLALLGVPSDIAAPANRSAVLKANRLRRRRCSELLAVHGYVSCGVSGIEASAALATAASRVVYAQAFASSDAALFKIAAQLADSARQCTLAGWELAAREGAARAETRGSELAAEQAAFQRQLAARAAEEPSETEPCP